MSTAAATPFTRTVTRLAAVHQIHVRIADQPLPGHGAHVQRHGRDPVIAVSTSLLEQPAPVQEFAAAHEVAHVVLRHGFWPRAWPALAGAAAMSLTQMGVLWWAMNKISDHNLAVIVVLVVGGLVPLLTCLSAWAVFAWRTRGCEIAADRLALSWGYTLTGSLEALNREENRFTTSRWYAPFRMHPRPSHRVAAGDVSQGSAAKEHHHDRPDPP